MAAKVHSTAPCAIPQTGKYTCYNRETMDHDCYYDGQYLGSRETAQQARELVDEYVYDLERSGLMYTAHQLDGGSSDEEIAADVAAPASADAPVGYIHGIPVYGAHYDEPGEECDGQLYRWSLDWSGKTISVYDDSDALNIHPVARVGCRGDVHLDDWKWLRSLAQTDIVDRLFALARGAGAPPTPAVCGLRDGSDPLAGYLPDGAPIHGEYLLNTTPPARWGVVTVDYPGWRVTMDDDGYFTIANDAGDGETLCDEWHMRDLPTRRAAVSHLLLSDTLERLHAAAVAWGRGEGPQEPPPVVLSGPALNAHNWRMAYQSLKTENDRARDALSAHGVNLFESEEVGEGVAELIARHPSAAPVRVEHHKDESGRWATYRVGDGLTKALISPHDDIPGVHLIIGGTSINDHLDQIITFADIRQLRDNLTTLLNDPCVRAAFADAPAPAQKAT